MLIHISSSVYQYWAAGGGQAGLNTTANHSVTKTNDKTYRVAHERETSTAPKLLASHGISESWLREVIENGPAHHVDVLRAIDAIGQKIASPCAIHERHASQLPAASSPRFLMEVSRD